MNRLLLCIGVAVILYGCKPCATCYDESVKLVRAGTNDSVFLHMADYRDNLGAAMQQYMDSGYTFNGDTMRIYHERYCTEKSSDLETYMENQQRYYGLRCERLIYK